MVGIRLSTQKASGALVYAAWRHGTRQPQYPTRGRDTKMYSRPEAELAPTDPIIYQAIQSLQP